MSHANEAVLVHYDNIAALACTKYLKYYGQKI